MRRELRTKLLPKILVILTLLIMIMNSLLATEEQDLKVDLLKLNDIKEEMVTAGLGVSRISDLITEGFLYFNSQDYNNTRKTISAVYQLKNLAFDMQKELADVSQLYTDAVKKNISLAGSSPAKIEWELEYAKKEFEKESYEETQRRLASVKKILLTSINNEYGYLNASLAALEEKITLLELSSARITTLNALLSQALEKGMVEELELISHEAENLNKSLECYEQINLIIPVLESKNLSNQRIIDELHTAKIELNLADYDSGLSRLENIKKLAENSLGLEEEINRFEKSLDEDKASYNSEFKEAEALVEKSKYALAIGNYEEAEQELISAKSVFEEAKAELLVKKAGLMTKQVSLKEFIIKNWAYILLSLLIILIVLRLTQKAWVYELRRKRLGWLEKELRVSGKMVQELQKKYFVHKKMSRESYDEAYEDLQEKTLSLKEKISLLNKRIKNQEKRP